MARVVEQVQPDPLPNVWLGASVESKRFVSRIEAVRGTPAQVHFLGQEVQQPPGSHPNVFAQVPKRERAVPNREGAGRSPHACRERAGVGRGARPSDGVDVLRPKVCSERGCYGYSGS